MTLESTSLYSDRCLEPITADKLPFVKKKGAF